MKFLANKSSDLMFSFSGYIFKTFIYIILVYIYIYNTYNMYVYLNISYIYVLRAPFTYFYVVVICNFCLFSYRQTYVYILFIFETFVICLHTLTPYKNHLAVYITRRWREPFSPLKMYRFLSRSWITRSPVLTIKTF